MAHETPPIFCAIDTPDLTHAITLCESLPEGIGIKLGLEFLNALGPQGVQEIAQNYPTLPLFLDFKYHDIPNTVAGAIRSITSIVKPAYLNIHIAGGRAMMEAAKAACPPETKLLGVTLLTSLDQDQIAEVGYEGTLQDRVVAMAKLAQDCGLDGVVCSSHEIGTIRQACGDDFILMVPGIRPAGSDQGDQKRVMPPAEALAKGATHLVIGRPITQADNPAQAGKDILNSLS